MARIFVIPFLKTVESLPDEAVFHTLRRKNFPIASSCQGDGVCAKCRIIVLRGSEHLTPPSPAEVKLIGREAIERNERLACQVCASDEIEITTTYW